MGEARGAITRRAFLFLVAAVGGSVLVFRERSWQLFQKRTVQPLVILKGSVTDGTAAVIGKERIHWKGEEVVGLCDCEAYVFPNQGLRYRVDEEVPQVPASAFSPSPGTHVIHWVAVDGEGNELEPPVLSFTALFS